MFATSVFLSTVFLLPSADSSRKYILKSTDTRRIEAVLTYEIKMPKLVAQEWIVYTAKAPELPSQTHVSTTMEPEGKASFELSQEHRPVMMAKASGQNGRRNELTIRVKYQATLRSRELVSLKRGRDVGTVEPLSKAARQSALELGGDFDWKSEPVQKWVRDHRLLRNKDESDIDFARRVFLAIKKNFTYEYKSEMNRRASAVCKAGKSDCGGLSELLVTILRGNDIPARTLEGRWAQSSKAKDLVGELPYYQTHVKAEFFASGVGWVPVDMATAILDKSGDGLNAFGHDPGDFLTLHVDSNLKLDTVHFGKQVVDGLQGPAYWVTGQGSVNPTETHEKWEVRTVK